MSDGDDIAVEAALDDVRDKLEAVQATLGRIEGHLEAVVAAVEGISPSQS